MLGQKESHHRRAGQKCKSLGPAQTNRMKLCANKIPQMIGGHLRVREVRCRGSSLGFILSSDKFLYNLVLPVHLTTFSFKSHPPVKLVHSSFRAIFSLYTGCARPCRKCRGRDEEQEVIRSHQRGGAGAV